MTEVERRVEYNKEALKTAERARMNMYPNLIMGVELPDACGIGKGILAVTDDVHNAVKRSLRYSPAFRDAEDAKGHKVKTPWTDRGEAGTIMVDKYLPSAETASLEDLL